MLRNRLYYAIKPFLPRGIRIAIRSWWATRKRKSVAATWPIMPGSERPPAGWKGWPHGKQFAFVLTHDVESQRGVERVPDVVRLEMDLGFRSSCNFVPEGGYNVPQELREDLVGNGFEVGVHDFHHDGYLYDSRHGFSQKAVGINQVLREWGAVGFRSGFMLNRLDWLHELDIEYDASTFDTDPFEPEPHGLGTIFPRWQGDASVRGYVELPYTLPQDSTLFLLFKQQDISVWLQKLDWVAQNGGMALVNVHSDYIDFGHGDSRLCYPAAFYSELLSEVLKRYGNSVWYALPKDVARHVSENRKSKITSKTTV